MIITNDKMFPGRETDPRQKNAPNPQKVKPSVLTFAANPGRKGLWWL